ncbi:ABC transporter substrate-binding protein [Sphingomonas bacterium]|uniref:ABC transporter substrate-binding protein n=1 Tax=Sphingomonas bacterium TaxID=1895847 RepID=UPI001575A632|nr:ABC transporter substrate-binding protein [Sphingomonas bacterium]
MPALFRRLAVLGLSLSTPLATAALAQASDPARAPVQALDDGLVQIMKAGKAAGARARAATIGPVVDRSFDLPLMTRLAVGPGWTAIAPADQTALVAAFRRLTIAQYAANFDGWSGESFTLAPQVESRGGDKLVRTTLNQPKGSAEALNYRLRDSGKGWRIIDVFYRNAVSQLATRRSDFANILQSGGAKALVTHLDALAAKGG